MKKLVCAFAAASLAISGPASAAKTVALQPIAGETQEVRYEQGIPTVENFSVRVMPLRELDHGSMQFAIAAFNSGDRPFNFGVENIKVSHNGQEVPVFTRDELEKKAKSRARWSQLGYALLAGAAAAAQNNNYTATTYTPRGVYRTVVNRPGLSGSQVATIAVGGGAIALSQIGLQKTLESIGEEVLQTTTVDPGEGYGGRIVVSKLKKAKAGDLITLSIEAGGAVDQFTFALQ